MPPRLGQPSRLLDILSSSTPDVYNEKAEQPTTLSDLPKRSASLDTSRPSLGYPYTTTPTSSIPPCIHSQPSSNAQHARLQPPYPAMTSSVASNCTTTTPSYTRPRGLRITNLIKPWIPIILYALSTLAFLAAIGFWKVEVFQGLDELSHWLQSDEYLGYAVIFTLIFLTTFPPIPLYSTLIILSGYTYGPWTGAIISYCASILGALAVFVLSRTFFRASISRWLSCTTTIKRVVRAIENNPKLLFLIRLAPYPYNVMNCLLAASPSLTLRTYTICTALSLPKLIIHTSIGSSIHSFGTYHVTHANGESADADENALGHYSTIAGITLCVAIFIYLSYITRKAVDDELEDEDALEASYEERVAFLSGEGEGSHDVEEHMVECPLSRPVLLHAGTDLAVLVTRPGPGG
ncbi:Golgi apparatus membrane protein tvp38 [Grifola frondosa]|uniref:Golgi apparatus membrane protein TVP38 n=1 Tax=Grifola frondosa TaxID=5627 RepID=A0A1C7MJE5_GRIFR|nr:Golgi apparatus membrane protein tvp38 [Grifola frondosa]